MANVQHYHIAEKASRWLSEAYFNKELAQFDFDLVLSDDLKDEFFIETCLQPWHCWWFDSNVEQHFECEPENCILEQF
jgi:hypothetical protein